MNRRNADEEDFSQTASTSSASTCSASNNLVSLCDYDLTDDEEKEETVQFEQRARKSPKKRKHLKRATGGTVGLFTKDLSNILFCESSLIESEQFDWHRHLVSTLESSFHDISISDNSVKTENVATANSDLSETEYEVDLNSLEISQVLKRKKKKKLTEATESHQNQDQQPSTSDIGVTDASDELRVTDSSDEFRVPKPRNRKFIFKPFVRNPTDGSLRHDETRPPVDVVIPEQLAASYGLYIWPCAPVLAWYIWLHQDQIRDKEVLELGAGTALPGLLCAKVSAKKVFLSDETEQTNTIKNISEAVNLNNLQDKVEVVGLTWGDYNEELFRFDSGSLDLIIGSDLFFDPDVFEPLIETIAYLLTQNPKAQVLIAVQERSSDWSIEEWLIKYHLRCNYIYPREFLKGTGIEESDLTGRHTIFILRLFKDA